MPCTDVHPGPPSAANPKLSVFADTGTVIHPTALGILAPAGVKQGMQETLVCISGVVW